MTECCSSQKETRPSAKRYVCPVNGKQYLEVPYRTMLHHVKNPWELSLKEQRYYFCDDPHCDVVYFGQDDACIVKSMLRTKVGVKEPEDSALTCYCFGVSRAEAKSNQQARKFVVEATKKATCSCEVSNPSGRCCLKDFPKQM